jgi:hypothetical protein
MKNYSKALLRLKKVFPLNTKRNVELVLTALKIIESKLRLKNISLDDLSKEIYKEKSYVFSKKEKSFLDENLYLFEVILEIIRENPLETIKVLKKDLEMLKTKLNKLDTNSTT